MAEIRELLEMLKGEDVVYVQTHNFPDHDAAGAAFALGELLERSGRPARLIYEGEIQRASLAVMIDALGIDLRHNSAWPLTERDKIIVVDGCKGNKNVTDLIGDEIAVIDHHQVVSPEDVRFSDIRPDYGSCCTIIHTYFRDLGLEPSGHAATAMMIGLSMDTSLMTRGVSPEDLDAYASLYGLADMQQVNSILRNQVQTRDLSFYKTALENVQMNDTFAFCYFPDGCNQNLMGILGDFFLSLQEIDFVALCARNGDKINFSLRSEQERWNASEIIQIVLKDIGFGGGHVDRAGGMIQDVGLFEENKIRDGFARALGIPS